MAKPVTPVIPEFVDFEVEVAKSQPQYSVLPSLLLDDPYQTFVSRWELSPSEVEDINRTKSIYLWVASCGRPINPVSITTGVDIHLRQLKIQGCLKYGGSRDWALNTVFQPLCWNCGSHNLNLLENSNPPLEDIPIEDIPDNLVIQARKEKNEH